MRREKVDSHKIVEKKDIWWLSPPRALWKRDKQGRHVVLQAKQTPLATRWLTLLQGAGIETNAFGDSTGTLVELTA
jgi:hypothetical protein